MKSLMLTEIQLKQNQGENHVVPKREKKHFNIHDNKVQIQILEYYTEKWLGNI